VGTSNASLDFGHLTRVFGQKKWASNWIPPCNFLRSAHRLPRGRQRGSDFFGRLYLIVFKPNGLLYVGPFQIDEVKAKRLFCIINYRTDYLDGAFQPSEGTITGYIDQTSYW
jgi:hypothetical protein